MDIGTGEGSFLRLLRNAGYENVVGIEPSKAPIECADKEIRDRIINDIFRAGQFEENSFQLITCFQTMEHLTDPGSMMKEIYRILEKNGIFFAVCHNYRSLVNRLLGFHSPIFDIEHLQLYSPKSIRFLLEKNGFQEVKVKSISNRYPLKYWVKLFPFPNRLKKRILRLFENRRMGELMIPVRVGNICILGKKQE